MVFTQGDKADSFSFSFYLSISTFYILFTIPSCIYFSVSIFAISLINSTPSLSCIEDLTFPYLFPLHTFYSTKAYEDCIDFPHCLKSFSFYLYTLSLFFHLHTLSIFFIYTLSLSLSLALSLSLQNIREPMWCLYS